MHKIVLIHCWSDPSRCTPVRDIVIWWDVRWYRQVLMCVGVFWLQIPTTASTATAASWTCGHSANEILRETANINSFWWDVKKLWNFHTMTSPQRDLYKKCKYVINTFWQFHDLRFFDTLLLSIVIFLLLCTSVGFSGLMT